MIPRLLACFLLLFLINTPLPGQDKAEAPLKATVCELKRDPLTYQHKMVELTGFAAQTGRENFDAFDPICPGWPDVRLHFGGKPFENIDTRLVDDARFDQFHDLLFPRHRNSVVHATILGRFFALGTNDRRHTNLLVIERIVSVDPHRSKTLDYLALADEPDLERQGCGYDDLTGDSRPLPVKAQERADNREEEWAFTDPKRVASDALIDLARGVFVNHTAFHYEHDSSHRSDIG